MSLQLLIAESDRFSPRALATLQRHFTVTCADLDRAALLSSIAPYDALWVRLRNQIDQAVFRAAPRLRWVMTNTTGLNHIDLAAAANAGVRVVSLRGEVDFLRQIRATAELTLGLILALVRHLPRAVAHPLAGGWNRDLFEGRELAGLTAGIVGYGRLGSQVAKYLHAMDLRVLTCGPSLRQADVAPEISVVSERELLAQAEIVSLHADYTSENDGFFGARHFAAMRPGAYFINTARGELIDEAALLDSLQTGHLAGAAVDVLRDERSTGMAAHPLIQYAQTHDNLLITPHIGGNTRESLHKTEDFLAEKLCHMLLAEASPPSGEPAQFLAPASAPSAI
ncbi:MAG: NAD(P)-dependent oxidoreductase [Pirellulales bacterium]|nr:NAD(P)-dependent oxidoreductase [Pirellulales bacterium]